MTFFCIIFGSVYCLADTCVWQESDAADDGVSEAESCSTSWVQSMGATGGSDSQVDSQLSEAVRLKTEGNAFYRGKNVRSAIGRYHRALLVLRGLDSEVMSSLKVFRPQSPTLTPEQDELFRSTQIDCYNNLAGRWCYNRAMVAESPKFYKRSVDLSLCSLMLLRQLFPIC